MSGIFSKNGKYSPMMQFQSTISYIYISLPGIVIVVSIDHYRYCTAWCFHFLFKVEDLEIPELDTASDEVNMEAFWWQVDNSMVARRLIRGNLRCGEFTSYSSDPSSQLSSLFYRQTNKVIPTLWSPVTPSGHRDWTSFKERTSGVQFGAPKVYSNFVWYLWERGRRSRSWKGYIWGGPDWNDALCAGNDIRGFYESNIQVVINVNF